jgi:hypothetical protein
MTQEQLRMQMLAGIITESQYKTVLNEDEDIDAQIAALQKQMDILKKSKQNKGGLNLTPEQLSVFKKEANKLYKQTKAGGDGLDLSDFAPLAAQELLYVIFQDRVKTEDEDDLAQELGFKDESSYFRGVEGMLRKMGYAFD